MTYLKVLFLSLCMSQAFANPLPFNPPNNPSDPRLNPTLPAGHASLPSEWVEEMGITLDGLSLSPALGTPYEAAEDQIRELLEKISPKRTVITPSKGRPDEIKGCVTHKSCTTEEKKTSCETWTVCVES